MPGTLLVSHPDWSWRTWIKDSLQGRDLICLDPSNAEWGWPARVFLLRQEKIVAWQFVGTLEASRNPIAVVSGLARFLEISPDSDVLLFPFHKTPVLRQLALACAQIQRPEEVLVPDSTQLELEPWPVGASVVELEPPLYKIAREAQRRARWIEMIEAGEDHEIDWTKIGTEGMRLGSGQMLPIAGFPGWAEYSGPHLHVLNENELDDHLAADILSRSGTSKMTVVHPEDYVGLVCSFAHQDGSDYGFGMIKAVDLARKKLLIRCTAVAPSPLRILKVGTIRIDETGIEAEPVKPWSI